MDQGVAVKLILQDEFKKLVDYLPLVKEEVEEWQLVNIHVAHSEMEQLQGTSVTDLLLAMFENHDGRLYQCNPHDLIAVIRWPSQKGQLALSRTLERGLPEDSCEIFVHAPDTDGLKKLEVRLCLGMAKDEVVVTERRSNCILIADDDLYMRTIIKKGFTGSLPIHEVVDGNEVLAMYKQYRPSIVFLDIHLPHRQGPEILKDIMTLDPGAYVIMLSSDSSKENVLGTAQMGAKGFLTKPFTKDKLLDLIDKCPGLRP